jgi:hypothetical protein
MNIEVEAEFVAGGRRASVANQQAGGTDRETPSHVLLDSGALRLPDDGIPHRRPLRASSAG